MVKLSSFIELITSFNSSYGVGSNLVHYLAMPRIPVNTFDFLGSVAIFMQRQDPAKMDMVGMAPPDVTIFRRRATLLSTRNRAYELATKINPSIQDLEDFAHLDPCWSTLFPVKYYLMNHIAQAREYRGFLPYGSEVIKYVNKALKGQWKHISGSPDYADHVFLRDRTNQTADNLNMPTVTINNIMHIQGSRITSGEVQEKPDEQIPQMDLIPDML